jgi:hypothetical protein
MAGDCQRNQQAVDVRAWFWLCLTAGIWLWLRARVGALSAGTHEHRLHQAAAAAAIGAVVIIITALPGLKQENDAQGRKRDDSEHQDQGELGGWKNQNLTHP